MKKIFLLTTIGALAIAGCTRMDFEGQDSTYRVPTEEEIKKNAEEIFGTTFDPNQDWTMTTTGSVKVTADADFSDIVEVQILSESPYLNSNAMILNKASVKRGETVELSYEAPKGAPKLIAACVNSLGEYYITSFDANATQVSFGGISTARTRGNNTGYPSVSDLKIDYKNSIQSYNAERTLKANAGDANEDIKAWENSNWENDRLWRVSDNENGSNGWQIINGSIVRETDKIDDREKKSLEDVFQTHMGGFENLANKYNNIEAVRNTNLFEVNNYLTSNGEPLIITPVEMSSFELGSLYYYYFDPNDLNGLNETQKVKYIKSLPKFKAVSCAYTREKAKEKGYVEVASNGKNYIGFFKTHEYLLPYYGDPRKFINELDHDKATTDGKVYRIRHEKKDTNGKYFYLSYLGSTDNMSPKLAYLYDDDADNIANQLWQIFDYNGKQILYNIGSKYYLITGNNKGEYTNYTSDINKLKNNLYEIIDKGDFILIKSPNNWGYLGSDITRKAGSFRIALNKPENDGEYVQWKIEEFNGALPDGSMMDNIDFGTIQFVKEAESISIPEGFNIGFFHRKENNSKGETYGDGRLNKEINTYSGYKTAVEQYGMRLTDPRIAIFKANGKKYMTFEEGTDCNFTDMVVEINSGVIEEPDPLKETVKGAVYTFCFEDHEDGDFDMNDVIIKAIRMDETHVLFSVEACGAHDELYLRNIHGKTLNNNVEIHKLFNRTQDSFVNTQGGDICDPIQEIVKVSSTYSFNNAEKDQIYIYNKTTGRNIKLSTKGQVPLAIVIPTDFEYPVERTHIHEANESFVKWGEGNNAYYNWYNYNIPSKVFKNAGFRILEKTKLAFPDFFKNDK